MESFEKIAREVHQNYAQPNLLKQAPEETLAAVENDSSDYTVQSNGDLILNKFREKFKEMHGNMSLYRYTDEMRKLGYEYKKKRFNNGIYYVFERKKDHVLKL